MKYMVAIGTETVIAEGMESPLEALTALLDDTQVRGYLRSQRDVTIEIRAVTREGLGVVKVDVPGVSH